MDPLSAVGLASNIISFIDFGLKLFSTSKQLYTSLHGATDEQVDLKVTVQDLKHLTESIELSSQQGATFTSARPEDKQLQDLAKKSRAVANELLEALDRLRVQSGNRVWQSFRSALMASMKDSKFKELKKRLKEYRSEIIACLTKMINDKQSDVLQILTQISQQRSHIAVRDSEKIEVLRHDLLRAIDNSNTKKADKYDLTALTSAVVSLNDAAKDVRKHTSIIDSLRFHSMQERYSKIHDAYSKTFEWAFDGANSVPQHALPDFLQRESGVFWVSGKAGSGKSTLVKYLLQHERTKAMLTTWAGRPDYVFCGFFFWAGGTPMQKSQEGLIRLIIHEILSRKPHLVPKLTPERWTKISEAGTDGTKDTWYRNELFDCLKRLRSDDLKQERFVFFIDGLDEYEGDDEELVTLLREFEGVPNIKLLLSSRPHNAFARAFGSDPSHHLVLQKYTRGDIRLYVSGALEDHPHFRYLRETDSEAPKLIESVVSKAQGVFLWVYLVVKSLTRGLTNADDIPILAQRVSDMPPDLEDYFQSMLESIEKIYRDETSRMLLGCIAAVEPLPVNVFKMLGSKSGPNLDDRNVKAPSAETVSVMEKQINARCTDLVEVDQSNPESPPELDFVSHKVDFLHRTVRDFLKTRELHDVLTSRLQGEFDVLAAISRAFMMTSKQVSSAIPGYYEPLGHCLDGVMIYARDREYTTLSVDEDLMLDIRSNLEFRDPWKEAASWGMNRYIRTVANGDPDRATDLLESALLNARDSIASTSSPRWADPVTVEALLKCGADANRCWAPYLSRLWKEKDEVHDGLALSDAGRVFRVFHRLLSAGAFWDIEFAIGPTKEKALVNKVRRETPRSDLPTIMNVLFTPKERRVLEGLIEEQKAEAKKQSWLPGKVSKLFF